MDQDQAGVEAEALQVGEDVPEDQQHAEDVQEMLEDMMPSPPEPEAAGGHHGPALLPQPQLGAVPRVGGGALLLRHASQSSLDESSQKFGHKLGEHRRPPYRNPGHPGKVSCHEAVIRAVTAVITWSGLDTGLMNSSFLAWTPPLSTELGAGSLSGLGSG